MEGVPKQPVVMVEEGVARDVVWDRRTAKQAGDGRASTGHALAPPAQAFGPIPFKVSRLDGRVVTVTPEFADVVRVAREKGLAVREVLDQVRADGLSLF